MSQARKSIVQPAGRRGWLLLKPSAESEAPNYVEHLRQGARSPHGAFVAPEPSNVPEGDDMHRDETLAYIIRQTENGWRWSVYDAEAELVAAGLSLDKAGAERTASAVRLPNIDGSSDRALSDVARSSLGRSF